MFQIQIPRGLDTAKIDDSFLKVLANIKCLNTPTVKGFDLFLAILNNMQYQFNASHKIGVEVTEYRCIFSNDDFNKFLQCKFKENTDVKKYSKQRLQDMKEKAVLKFVKEIFVSERCTINGKLATTDIYALFSASIRYDNDCNITSYEFRTTEEGTEWANKMFTYLEGESYSHYLIGIGCNLSSISAKSLLGVICRYYQAIIQGKWANDSEVIFNLDNIYDICNITSKNSKVNKEALLKALDEINNNLTSIGEHGIVDKEGYKVKICVKYLRNDEYRNMARERANKETHIKFYSERISDKPVTMGGQGTIQELVGIDDSKYKTNRQVNLDFNEDRGRK